MLDIARSVAAGPYGKWVIALLVLIAGYFLVKIINFYIRKFFQKVSWDRTVETFIQNLSAVVLWVILFLVVLSNLGVNVSSFLVGLGVAGFIIGFATKDVLSNFAAGVFLLINKPFNVGEDVDVLGIKGNVKEITVSTTVVHTKDKVFVVMPNSKIWGGPIKNFSRLK